VMDPQLRRFGPLWIARQHVRPSLAVDAPEDGLAPHLCLRFQTGECRSGPSCPQRHLDPTYMAALRDSLAGTHFSDCCLLHGNIASLRPDFRRLLSHTPVLITVDSEFEVGIPRAHDVIAVTSFWHQYLTDRDPRVPVTFNSVRICRLHQRQACKFGRDCNARIQQGAADDGGLDTLMAMITQGLSLEHCRSVTTLLPGGPPGPSRSFRAL